MSDMAFVALSLVVLSGLMNAVWNLLAKRSRNKQAFLGSIGIPCVIALFPIAIAELGSKPLPPQAYLLIFLSMAAQAGYALMLSKAYKIGDLSQVYPIQRGTGVVLIPLLGVIFMGERLGGWGWFGVATIVAGMFSINDWRRASALGAGAPRWKPVLAALAVGLCITSYVLVDKLTLQYVSPLTLLQLSTLGFVLGNVPAMMRWGALREEWKHSWKTILAGSFLSPGSYLLFLVAMQMAPVSHLAPVREVGTVFAALLGVWLLKEPNAVRRLATAATIALGIIIVGVGG